MTNQDREVRTRPLRFVLQSHLNEEGTIVVLNRFEWLLLKSMLRGAGASAEKLAKPPNAA
jgi:hypothetical protein